MKFFMVDGNGATKSYDLPDDFRMDELFCQINSIPEDVSDDEVHAKMAASNQSLFTKNGGLIRFADHANGTTTLSELGITGDTEYHLTESSERYNG